MLLVLTLTLFLTLSSAEVSADRLPPTTVLSNSSGAAESANRPVVWSSTCSENTSPATGIPETVAKVASGALQLRGIEPFTTVVVPKLKHATTSHSVSESVISATAILSIPSDLPGSAADSPPLSAKVTTSTAVPANLPRKVAAVASSALQPRVIAPFNTVVGPKTQVADPFDSVVAPKPTRTASSYPTSGLATSASALASVLSTLRTPVPDGTSASQSSAGSTATLTSDASLSSVITIFDTTTAPGNTSTHSSSVATTVSAVNVSSSTGSTYLSSPTPAARYRGFNVVNQSPANPGVWKSLAEWYYAFEHIKALPGDFNAVRLYSTTDGMTHHLLNALPVARALNLSVLVGVWSGGDDALARFGMEIDALDEALGQLGCDNIIAVSVGNEDMYSGHLTNEYQRPLKDVMLLVNQTQNVTGVLARHGCGNVRLTHTDTFSEWLNVTAAEPLIRQVDFLTVNIFPYWENTSIADAASTFWSHVNDTRNVAAKYGKDVWIGETGWPLTGTVRGSAVPSASFAHQYWSQVGCRLMQSMNAFWYAEWDDFAAPSFGLMHSNGTSYVGDLSCGL